ncbi:hypothetical protein [Mucilaginibacter sp. L196]|uniref:hypothetical protein n=1 Tax=Mucilaginibacter sp. L196 TaxID=1641870 RepID=UPI00131B3CCE|nr:hypothetical protein [Mucilaginibacter sp. L196]
MNLIDESEDKSLPYVATIIVAVVIGLVGIYLRFADFRYSSEVADVIFGIATIIIFTSVFKWMKK